LFAPSLGGPSRLRQPATPDSQRRTAKAVEDLTKDLCLVIDSAAWELIKHYLLINQRVVS
jgi:hypothetical protein